MNYKKILIIKPSALGDIVMAMPMFNAIRSAYPDAHISWFVRKEFADFLRVNPKIDDLIIFDRKKLSKFWINADAFKELRSLINKLKMADFDLVIDCQGLFRTAFFAWVTGCKNRIGLANAREGAPLFYTNKVKMPENSVHVIDHYMKLAKESGAKISKIEYGLVTIQKDIESVKSKLESKGLNGRDYAVIVPGASREAKVWPGGKFAILAEKIFEEFGLVSVLSGSPGEKKITEVIAKVCKVPVIDMAGETSMPELTAMIANGELTVSNDTGPGHIGVATGKPVLILFGPINPARLRPYGNENGFVNADPDWNDDMNPSISAPYKIEDISVDMVMNKIRKQLEKKSGKM